MRLALVSTRRPARASTATRSPRRLRVTGTSVDADRTSSELERGRRTTATGSWSPAATARSGPAAAAAPRAACRSRWSPAGTANDFARALGLPDDVDEALRAGLRPGARRRASTSPRADGAAVRQRRQRGLAVAAAQAAEPLKGALGPLAYAVGALRAG